MLEEQITKMSEQLDVLTDMLRDKPTVTKPPTGEHHRLAERVTEQPYPFISGGIQASG